MSIKKEHYTIMPCDDPTYHTFMRYIPNSYWVCIDGDTNQALFFKGRSPQCNTNIKIAEKLALSVVGVDDLEIVFVPNGYAPIELKGY